jgi:hypothetical protein
VSVRRVLAEAGESAAVAVSRAGVGLRLRLAVLGGMALALLASVAAAGLPPWVAPVLLIAGACTVAVRPDTHLGLGVLVAFGWYWLAHVDGDDDRSPWVLLAAAGLLLFHLAASAAALGPPETELPRPLLVAWARRSAPILGAGVALWLVTAGLRRADLHSNAALTTAALLIVVAGAWIGLARSGPSDPAPPDDEGAGRRTP